jgi:hypothetical protein
MRFILSFMLLFGVSSMLFSETNPVGEEASYKLNDGRSSWIIQAGNAFATVKEYLDQSAFGPGYVVEINYDMDILFKGKQRGKLGLLVPASVFATSFFLDLANARKMAFGSFDVDFVGIGDARDADNHNYARCTKSRIYNIKPNYKPGSSIKILWHRMENPDVQIENLEIKLAMHMSVPVLKAVQLDVAGTAQGFSFTAGFDYMP